MNRGVAGSGWRATEHQRIRDSASAETPLGLAMLIAEDDEVHYKPAALAANSLFN